LPALLAVKILRPRTLLAFTLILLVSFTTASLSFNLLYGFKLTVDSALSGVTSGTIIMQEGSQSVYRSRVPLSLVESLNRIPGVHAEASVLVPALLNGKPIVIRAITNPLSYRDKLVAGRMPGNEAFWLLLGERASKRLGLGVGDIVFVGSPVTKNLLILPIVGIYSIGNLLDYEAAAPLEVGDALAGRSHGTVSLIEVKGIGKEEVKRLLKRSYNLTIQHPPLEGELLILDSVSSLLAATALSEGGSKTFSLPFGYYTLVYRTRNFASNVTNLLLMDDKSVNLANLGKGTFTLKVPISGPAEPLLKLEDGTQIPGTREGAFWTYRVPQGVYILELINKTYRLLVLGDTVFNPQTNDEAFTIVRLSVFWQDGEPVSEYHVLVTDSSGALIASIAATQPTIPLGLPKGEFTVKVSRPPYLIENSIRIPGQDTLTIRLPRLSNPGRIPPEMYRRLSAISPLDASEAALGSLVGVTVAALLITLLSLTILSIIAGLSIYRGLYHSSKTNISILIKLGAGLGKITSILGPTTLTVTLLIGTLSAYLAHTIHLSLSMDLNFTFLGYGIPFSLKETTIYSVSLALISWFASSIRLPSWLGEEVE
jgi:hypothetical protein